MKKILFVMNTLGKGGAEVALMELLRRLLDAKNTSGDRAYELYLYVLTGQGEMIKEVPAGVNILNKKYEETSVLSEEGRKYLKRTVISSLIRRGNLFRLFPYLFTNLIRMVKAGGIRTDKLLWRVISDGADRFDVTFDAAIAYLEGGSVYYVNDHVRALKKLCFMHTDYVRAGYTRKLDRDAYLYMDRIFAVSEEAGEVLRHVYPECRDKIYIFHNLINRQKIIEKSKEKGGFSDCFDGKRILTVGRLEKAKALEISIMAMKILKAEGFHARWYVLGEGSERKNLEKMIDKEALTDCFILCGAVENPYPFMAQADIYVHASRREGRSLAIQEAQILGKPMIISDCSGNKGQVTDGVDGFMCSLNPKEIAEKIKKLLNDEELGRQLGKCAAERYRGDEGQMEKLTEVFEG